MLASFSSQHLESHLHDPGNPLYDSITKNHALDAGFGFVNEIGEVVDQQLKSEQQGDN